MGGEGAKSLIGLSTMVTVALVLVPGRTQAQPTITPILMFTPILTTTTPTQEPLSTVTSIQTPLDSPTAMPTSTTAPVSCEPAQYGADHSSTDPETGHCYLGFDTAVTWLTAEATCQQI